MSLPSFTSDGLLPPGEHRASWGEVVERFGGNEARRALLVLLGEALTELHKAGCREVWLNGSFATAEEFPGDVDVLYDAHGIQPRLLDPRFDSEAECRAAFGGDYLAVDAEWHMSERPTGLFKHFSLTRDGEPKGIVRLSLSNWSAPR